MIRSTMRLIGTEREGGVQVRRNFHRGMLLMLTTALGGSEVDWGLVGTVESIGDSPQLAAAGSPSELPLIEALVGLLSLVG
jgi:hypothetical protein